MGSIPVYIYLRKKVGCMCDHRIMTNRHAQQPYTQHNDSVSVDTEMWRFYFMGNVRVYASKQIETEG